MQRPGGIRSHRLGKAEEGRWQTLAKEGVGEATALGEKTAGSGWVPCEGVPWGSEPPAPFPSLGLWWRKGLAATDATADATAAGSEEDYLF